LKCVHKLNGSPRWRLQLFPPPWKIAKKTTVYTKGLRQNIRWTGRLVVGGLVGRLDDNGAKAPGWGGHVVTSSLGRVGDAGAGRRLLGVGGVGLLL